MTKCPKCRASAHPGYFTFVCETTYRTVVVRCEVCKGTGLATTMQIMSWEASL